MSNQLADRLTAVKRRLDKGGPTLMQLGGDPNAKVWPGETWKICDSQNDVEPLLSAVRAVLELHKPTKDVGPTGGFMEPDYLCRECCKDAETEGTIAWPCPTWQAIERELGGE